MNLKKLLLLIVIAGIVVVFIFPGKFERSVFFLNQEFEHAETLKRGNMHSYFYTVSAVDPEQANSFIQLIVFDEEAGSAFVSAIFEQAQGSFSLAPLSSDNNLQFGQIEKGVYAYARTDEFAPIKTMAIYVESSKTGLRKSKAKTREYGEGLRDIQAQINSK